MSRGLLLVGDADILAPRDAACDLANEGGWEFEVIAGAGHAAPIEQPVAWRQAVLAFLNQQHQNNTLKK